MLDPNILTVSFITAWLSLASPMHIDLQIAVCDVSLSIEFLTPLPTPVFPLE